MIVRVAIVTIVEIPNDLEGRTLEEAAGRELEKLHRERRLVDSVIDSVEIVGKQEAAA